MGKRVKARGGNKIKKLAVGGGIGAAAGAAAEKASKDKGTERASKAKKYENMSKPDLVKFILAAMGTAAR